MMATLDDVLTAELRAERAQKEWNGTSRWYASGSGMCWRQRWYQARDVERDPGSEPDARAILAMDVGTWLHERIQAALVRAGGDAVVAEVSWRDEQIGFGARADLIVNGPAFGLGEDQTPCTVEIKTLAGYGFRVAVKAGEPEERHVAQGMHSAVAHGHRGVLVVYLSRDTLATASWWIPVTDEWRQRIQHELHRIAELDKRDKPPHRVIPGIGVVGDPLDRAAPWHCRYCSWRERCTVDGE